MENYPGNSKTRVEKTERVVKKSEPKEIQGPEKPKIEKLVVNEVVRRKKPLGKRFKETFLGGDDAKGVWAFLITTVIVPAAQDMFLDAVNEGANRMVHGGSSSPLRRHAGRAVANAGHVAYNRFSDNRGGGYSSSTIRREPREDPRPQLSRQARRTHNFDEIILTTRAEASHILEQLDMLVSSQYGQASVSDLYEMVDITADWTDEKWGWDNLQGARVVHIREGYLLDLPAPIPLTSV